MLVELNARAFKKLPGSRQSAFEAIDRPALKALPSVPYEYADWKKVRVHLDYHIEFVRHYYSVPHALVGKELDARVSATTVELFHRGARVASHIRSRRAGGFTTCPEHMPASHREYAKWTPERLRESAATIGPATACVISAILAARRHPQQGFRSALGVLLELPHQRPHRYRQDMACLCARPESRPRGSQRALRASAKAIHRARPRTG